MPNKNKPNGRAFHAPDHKGMPTNIDAERFVLGSFMLDNNFLRNLDLEPLSFTLRRHQQIFRRMIEIRDRGDVVDRLTVANELACFEELDECGGMTYLVELDDGLPQIPNIDSYVKIVKEKHLLRKIATLGQRVMNVALADRDKPAPILRRLGQAVASMEVEAGQKSMLMTPGEILESLGGIQKFSLALDPGISWGYPQLDNYLLGMQRQCQYLIGGRTGSGKSALAMNMAMDLAERGEPVLFLSMEMSKEALLTRAICSRSEVPIKAFMRHNMSTEQVSRFGRAAHEIADFPVYIDDTAGMTISDAARKVHEAVEIKKIRAFFLDHLHRLNWQGEHVMKVKDEYSAFTTASWVLCGLARQHDLTSVVLVQLSRPADKRKQDLPPTLADIRATGALEQDATGVIFIHRPEQFKAGEAHLRGVAKLIVAKSRNGEEGECAFHFRSSTTTFTDEAEGLPPKEEKKSEAPKPPEPQPQMPLLP